MAENVDADARGCISNNFVPYSLWREAFKATSDAESQYHQLEHQLKHELLRQFRFFWF